MARRVWQWMGTDTGLRLLVCLAALLVLAGGWAFGDQVDGFPAVTEGSLVFRSPSQAGYGFVPLEHTDVEIDVRGLVAAATVTQRYTNQTDEALEAVYVFPLPHDAAVYDMEVRIGERVIRSVIREREEAKRTYEAARADGKRAALLDEERPNIFTASIANIMPRDRIEVRIRYVQPLAWEDGRVRLVFPMVVGPRYVPGAPEAVPDAGRITPPVRAADSRPAHDISLQVRVDAGLELRELSSPTHAVTTTRIAGGTHTVQLAAEQTLPNRDFVLEFQRAESRAPKAALFLSPDAKGKKTHFMLVAFPPSLQREDERPPMEMLFLIDISGSMAGTSIRQAREALLLGLDRLRPTDRFDVVAFDNEHVAFRPEPVAVTSENVEAGRRFVRGLDARGGTEMLPALETIMAMPASPGFLRCIVVLTDGDLGNEEQIFASLRRKLGAARLFTVAIGGAPNHFLATKMAQFGRGSFSSIADGSEIRARMGQLLDTIESPVLADVSLRIDGAELAEVYPARIPDLFLGRPLVVFGRILGSDGARGTVHLEGVAREKHYAEEIPFDTASASFHPGITTLWARQRIEAELDLWRASSDDAERDRRKAAIVEDALHYNLVTRFTSLVAVEDVVVNGGEAPRSVAVPTELPHGWQRDKVFGGNPQTGTPDGFLELLGLGLLAVGLLLANGRRRAEALR